MLVKMTYQWKPYMTKNKQIISSSAYLALLDFLRFTMMIKKVETVIFEKQSDNVLDSDEKMLPKKKSKKKNTKERKRNEKS